MLLGGCSPSALSGDGWMKCTALQDRINQMETSNDSPGSLALGGGSEAHTERLEQGGRSIWELEGKMWRRLTVGKEIWRLEEAAEVETLGHGWDEAQGPAGYLSSAGEEAALKQCPVLWQAQDVGLVAGALLVRATPAYLPDHMLFWGIQWSVEKNILE